MQERRQPVLYEWEGDIPLREIPTDILYDVHIAFDHDAERRAAAQLRAALIPFGRVRVSRFPLLGTRIRVRGETQRLDVRVKDDRVQIRLHNRVKGRALARLVEAVGVLQNSRDLQIRASSPHFDPAFTDVRPCTTCAASRFPPSVRRD